ncbi:NAD(P)H-binding protein [Streptomyces kanamyceticus]|uniref:SDR family NAD(P)-dependent oxidoreductase n=1 Tax=Streptomyces kanamyceticus TaxID=1967 RepID=A0A5J6GKH6_STRKN|nr:NAD(P)H-binding protein [Streptomyces kanamyceticus]QEU95949.1 SDR family NAD(P)-dependent oxidoreductase [Streptomyces kanamyceticus]
MTEHPILITGGTGKVGGRAAARLGLMGVPVRVASRSGEPRFDWQDRTTWRAALDGVRKVLLVPYDGELLTRPFLQYAKELGVERVVLLSGRGADVPGYASEDSAAGRTHIDGEDAVRTCGLEWTILRPAWFAQNFSEGFFRDAVLAGELRLPAGDGAAAFVDAEDIAAVAVAALTEDQHVGETYELSGPGALTIGEAAALITEATGRTVRYVPLAHGDFVAELIAEGWPEADAEEYADAVGPIRRGMDSHLSDGVRAALGRPARPFARFVEEAAAAGAWRDLP